MLTFCLHALQPYHVYYYYYDGELCNTSKFVSQRHIQIMDRMSNTYINNDRGQILPKPLPFSPIAATRAAA